MATSKHTTKAHLEIPTARQRRRQERPPTAARRLKVLFLASEVAPFTKTGGLADVAGSLPKALAALGHDVRVVTPAYAATERGADGSSPLAVLPFGLEVPMGTATVAAGAFEGRLPGSDVPIYFVAERTLLARNKPYGHDDDPYRFAFFSRAALDLAIAAIGWRPDVVHVHDWHTAAAILWLATAGRGDERYRGLPTLLTIHNLQHQGWARWDLLGYLGVVTSPLREEPYDSVNLMARGIYHATKVTTVSPSYAREITTPMGGAGLDGLLRHRHSDLHGILNGIDYDVWNPATDVTLARHFNARTIHHRPANKRALQARLGLPQRDDVPIVAMVTRLDAQKGLGITGHVVHLLMNNLAGEAQFVVLGSGAPEFEDMFRHLASYHRQKMAAVLGYDASLAPLVYAGSDVFLMPSLFEPCGLGQLIAMRYGAVPVVRATGGLIDTVRDGVTGLTFSDFDPGDCWEAVRRALYIWHHDQDSWRAMQQAGMLTDSSWLASARGYQQLYEWAMAATA